MKRLVVEKLAEANFRSREEFINEYVKDFKTVRYLIKSLDEFRALPPLEKLCQISALYHDFNEDEIKIIKAFKLAETPEQKAELVDCYLSNQIFFEHLIHQLSKL